MVLCKFSSFHRDARPCSLRTRQAFTPAHRSVKRTADVGRASQGALCLSECDLVGVLAALEAEGAEPRRLSGTQNMHVRPDRRRILRAPNETPRRLRIQVVKQHP